MCETHALSWSVSRGRDQLPVVPCPCHVEQLHFLNCSRPCGDSSVGSHAPRPTPYRPLSTHTKVSVYSGCVHCTLPQSATPTLHTCSHRCLRPVFREKPKLGPVCGGGDLCSCTASCPLCCMWSHLAGHTGQVVGVSAHCSSPHPDWQ